MPDTQLEAALLQIRNRFEQIKGHSLQAESFLLHLRTLGRWQQDPMDYPQVAAEFPKTIHIAHAVCHPECGTAELIVDGSTQECQRCGGLMFRTSVRKYERKEED